MSDERDIEHESGPEESAPVVRRSRRRSRRRSFAPRFGLRSLLIAGILFSVAFAWIGRGLYRVHQEDAAIEAIERAGGLIRMDYVPGSSDALVESSDSDASIGNQLGGSLQRAIGWTDRPSIQFIAIWMTDQIDARSLDGAVEALPSLPEILHLSLQGVEFDDSTVESLRRMPRLESLDLGFTMVTGDGLANLEASEHLRELGLAGETNPDVLSGLRALTRLRELRVGYRDLSREDVAAIASLPELNRLDLLAATPVGENVYTPLAKAKSLRVLEFVARDADGFDEGDLQAIGELPDLRELTIDGLTKENLAALKIPAGLRILTISDGFHPEAARRLDGREDIPPEELQRFSAEHPLCEVRCIQYDGNTTWRHFFLDGEPIDPPAEWK